MKTPRSVSTEVHEDLTDKRSKQKEGVAVYSGKTTSGISRDSGVLNNYGQDELAREDVQCKMGAGRKVKQSWKTGKMESETSDPEQARLSFFGKAGKSSGEIDSGREPLIDGNHSSENYSVLSAILPLYHFGFLIHNAMSDSMSFRFLFPALGGLLYGYDIGATSGATISLESLPSGRSSSGLIWKPLKGQGWLTLFASEWNVCIITIWDLQYLYTNIYNYLQSSTLSGTTWYNLTSVEVGLIVSGSLYGALIGSVLAFNIADFLGRRRELILSSLLYLVGALVTALAPDFPIIVIGRFVFGIGIGLAMHAAPMYIAETAPSQIRGRLISLKEFFIVLGMLLGYTVGSLEIDIVSGWRYMYGTSLPISVIMGIGMWWLPPSPRWLLLCAVQEKGNMQDLKETAICCLCRLRGQAIGDSAPEQVDEILVELSYVDPEKEPSLREIFKGKCLKALIIGGGLVLFQQITGQPSVLYYAATILQSAGFSAASDATRVSILLGLLKLIMTGIAVLVVDRLGRRPLLLGGVSGIVISLFLLASYYIFLNNAPVVAVVALLLYVGCYQVTKSFILFYISVLLDIGVRVLTRPFFATFELRGTLMARGEVLEKTFVLVDGWRHRFPRPEGKGGTFVFCEHISEWGFMRGLGSMISEMPLFGTLALIKLRDCIVVSKSVVGDPTGIYTSNNQHFEQSTAVLAFQ
ncbi:hypothetical protein HHK36_028431 [Tetracentron sinense]|uniref:Major facilitator superfamily (MFS) profile domain-containing protein n=1 Tax=Tetracentron sinense TaxID=13715 RepID=A0A834YDD7_TETSI|nr:hypothetical protein HHK36_028431 [Tetracentron sinense]